MLQTLHRYLLLFSSDTRKVLESSLSSVSSFVNGIFEIRILGISAVLLPISFAIIFLFGKYLLVLNKVRSAVKLEKLNNNGGKNGFLKSVSALASCVGGALGMGNIIAGCVSVKMYGAGILFWIIVLAIIISASKFFEVALSCMSQYRKGDRVNNNCHSGPLVYIKNAFSIFGNKKIGSGAVAVFAFLFGSGYLLISIIQASQFVTMLPTSNCVSFGVTTVIGLMVLFFILKNMKEIGLFSLIFVPAMLLIQLYICIKIVILSKYTFFELYNVVLTSAFDGSTAPIQVLIAYAMQRMILATDVGTGISGMLSSESKINNRIKQGLLSAIEPLLTGVVVFLVGIAIVSIDSYSVMTESGISIITSQIKSGFDLILFTISIFMFAVTTVITRSYCVVKSFSFLTNGRFAVSFSILVAISVALSPYFNFNNILAITDIVLILAATINLIAIILIVSKKGTGKLFDKSLNRECNNATIVD
ncbi:MAG: alanine:cation symporter family protein [Alphaproteobacteria bacterium]|nr:alanine:cation symporter family protein [Rickettsiales bacterium]